jgi:hypothetical protein
MFRLTRTDYPKHIMLVVEGQLVGENLEAIESACEEALSTKAQVTVFLKDITGIDAKGQAFLKRLATTNARLRALGIYSRYLVRRLMRGGNLPCVS